MILGKLVFSLGAELNWF